MKKVLAIVSSPRKGGNSELLVDEFVKGAEESGHTVEKVCLREKKDCPLSGLRGLFEKTAAPAFKRMI